MILALIEYYPILIYCEFVSYLFNCFSDKGKMYNCTHKSVLSVYTILAVDSKQKLNVLQIQLDFSIQKAPCSEGALMSAYGNLQCDSRLHYTISRCGTGMFYLCLFLFHILDYSLQCHQQQVIHNLITFYTKRYQIQPNSLPVFIKLNSSHKTFSLYPEMGY